MHGILSKLPRQVRDYPRSHSGVKQEHNYFALRWAAGQQPGAPAPYFPRLSRVKASLMSSDMFLPSRGSPSDRTAA